MTFCLAVLLAPLLGIALLCRTGRRSAAQLVGAAMLWAMAAGAAVGVGTYGRGRRTGWHERLEMTLQTLPVAAVLGAVMGALAVGARLLRHPAAGGADAPAAAGAAPPLDRARAGRTAGTLAPPPTLSSGGWRGVTRPGASGGAATPPEGTRRA